MTDSAGICQPFAFKLLGCYISGHERQERIYHRNTDARVHAESSEVSQHVQRHDHTPPDIARPGTAQQDFHRQIPMRV